MSGPLGLEVTQTKLDITIFVVHVNLCTGGHYEDLTYTLPVLAAERVCSWRRTPIIDVSGLKVTSNFTLPTAFPASTDTNICTYILANG